MARRRKPRLSGQAPVAIDSYPQPTTVDGRVRAQQFGGPVITLFSSDPPIQVAARLRAPVTTPLPRPRIAVVDRPDVVGLTQWLGRNPYEMVVPIRFDAYAARRSIERDIDALASLAVRHRGHREPPIVQLAGPIPKPAETWRVADFTEIADQTIVNANGRITRFAVDVSLIEYAEDRLLEASRAKNKTGKKTARIRKGESLHEFAKRVLGDRGRARDVARANSLRLGYRAKAEHTLRLP